MAALTSQSLTQAGLNPTPITPTASDTIAEAQFGVLGVELRVITTGTTTNITVSDPGSTAQGNPGTVTPVACPASGVRRILIPRTAIASTGVATIAASGALTGVTYELTKLV